VKIIPTEEQENQAYLTGIGLEELYDLARRLILYIPVKLDYNPSHRRIKVRRKEHDMGLKQSIIMDPKSTYAWTTYKRITVEDLPWVIHWSFRTEEDKIIVMGDKHYDCVTILDQKDKTK